jgi:hypothetical protein
VSWPLTGSTADHLIRKPRCVITDVMLVSTALRPADTVFLVRGHMGRVLAGNSSASEAWTNGFMAHVIIGSPPAKVALAAPCNDESPR